MLLFFFKQKTAYEMRISDWSSDVCSSDLNARFAEDMGPLDPRCACPVCATWSRAYLHHLVKAGEMLGAMLMTQHNIHFYQALMQEIRDSIAAGRFASFAADFRRDYQRA